MDDDSDEEKVQKLKGQRTAAKYNGSDGHLEVEEETEQKEHSDMWDNDELEVARAQHFEVKEGHA